MSKLPIDLSKFKKIKSDDKTSTLKHVDGHQLIIAHGKLSPKLREQLEKLPVDGVKKFADGGDTGNVPNPTPNESPDVPVQQDTNTQAPPEIEAVDPNNPEAQAPGMAPSPAPAAPPSQNTDSSGPADNEEESDQDQGNFQPSNKPMAAPAPQTAAQIKQGDMTAAMTEDAAVKQDFANGHIEPKTYADLMFKNPDGSDKPFIGKIGSIFGLLLSGAGSGLSHQPNALLSMMNNEISNDIEAQKQSKTNVMNLYKLNQENEYNKANIGKLVQEGKLTQQQAALVKNTADVNSDLFSRMQANRIVLHKLSLDAANANLPPDQRAAAQDKLKYLADAVDAQNYNLADVASSKTAYLKTLLGQSGANAPQNDEQAFQQRNKGLGMLGPKGEQIQKYETEHHFPGLPGSSSVPLSDGDRDSINSGIDFDQKLNRFMNWTASHSGDLSPTDKNTGTALASELQGAYRQATHGGVYKEGEQNFISKLIDQTPTKFFNNVRVMPQLKAIASENQARVNQLVKSKGFPGYPGANSAQPQSQQSSPQIKVVNGVKYMRGPNGQAIPVK